MHSKYTKLTVYENNLLNEDLIHFIIKSRSIVTNKLKKKLLIEWYKTNWLIKNNIVAFSERKNLDYPGCIEALTYYINKKRIWPINNNVPWAYFVALALGLRPESEKTWALLSPAEIGLNMFQANLKIISGEQLDVHRKKIMKKAISRFGGEIVFSQKTSSIFLIKLPKIFEKMQSLFPNNISNLSSDQFSSSDKTSKLWRTLMTEIEMEWHQLKPNEFGINALWAWGWGSMPSNLECISSQEKQKKIEFAEESDVVSLMISGLIIWLKTNIDKKFLLKIPKNSMSEIDDITLKNYSEKNYNKKLQEKISICVQEFTEHLTLFNKNIENNNFEENIIMYSNKFNLTKNNDYIFTKFSKLIFNIKSRFSVILK